MMYSKKLVELYKKEYYSDDNCTCRGEQINKWCPRHGK
jgi:hypothetical protein